MKTFFRRGKGQALAEFALSFPLGMLIFLMSLDMLSFVWQRLVLESLTRSLARTLSVQSPHPISMETRARRWLDHRNQSGVQAALTSRVLPRIKRAARFDDQREIRIFELTTQQSHAFRFLPSLPLTSTVRFVYEP